MSKKIHAEEIRPKESENNTQVDERTIQNMDDTCLPLWAAANRPMEECKFSITVDRAEFQKALRILAKFVKSKRASEAVLSHVEGQLSIDLPGGNVLVDAKGEWAGTVRVPGAIL